jgi:hypothetical protein
VSDVSLIGKQSPRTRGKMKSMKYIEGVALRQELSMMEYSAERIADAIRHSAPKHARTTLVCDARELRLAAAALRERVLAVTGD